MLSHVASSGVLGCGCVSVTLLSQEERLYNACIHDIFSVCIKIFNVFFIFLSLL